MNSPPAHPVPSPHPSVAITNAPSPMTMSEEDAELLRTKARGSVGKWIADEVTIMGFYTLFNNEYTITYAGPERGFELEGHHSLKFCCFPCGTTTSEGRFDVNGLGGDIRDSSGATTKYELVSLDKVNQTATYAIFGQDPKGFPITGSAVQSDKERRVTLKIRGAPPEGFTLTYRR